MKAAEAEPAETYGGPANLATSMWSLFKSGHDRNPDKTAIISIEQEPGHLEGLVGSAPSRPPPPDNSSAAAVAARDNQHLTWTYAQLWRGASRLASVAKSTGVTKGSAMAVFVPTCAEFALFLWLSVILEVTLVPLDPRVLDSKRRDEELRFYLERLRPLTVVVPDRAAAATVDGMDRKLGIGTKMRIYLSEAQDKGDGSFELEESWLSMDRLSRREFTPADDKIEGPTHDDPKRIASIQFTSGTSTGIPKGCPRTTSSWHINCFERVDSNTIFVLTSPVFRAIALTLSVSIFCNGLTIVLPRWPPLPPHFIEAVEMYKGTMVLLVPFQMYSIGDDPSYSRARLRSLKEVYIGGDVTTVEVYDHARRVFPDAMVSTVHGMTEGAGVIWWNHRNECTKNTPIFKDVVASGKALLGTRLRIVDDNEKRNVLKRGEIGELHISSPNMIERYMDDIRPELFYEDELGKWIIPGDMASISDSGYVFILGRSKDVIKRGGIPVVPSAIESCLNGHAGVKVSKESDPSLHAVSRTLPSSAYIIALPLTYFS